MDDSQATNDPMTMRELRACRLLKYFTVPRMRSHVCLLDHFIRMWDPDQQNFQVGTHILTIYVEDIYFLTVLSRRGSPESLIGIEEGEMYVDDLIDEYCTVGKRSQGGNILIKHIVDRSLRTVAFTIEKVVCSRSSHKNT